MSHLHLYVSQTRWAHCMGRMLQVNSSDASSLPYRKSSVHTSQSILRQHVRAIKQLQACKCATMLTRFSARSHRDPPTDRQRPKTRLALSGPNPCTGWDREWRQHHERDTNATIGPGLVCGRHGVAALCGLPKATKSCTNGTTRGECRERGMDCAAAAGSARAFTFSMV